MLTMPSGALGWPPVAGIETRKRHSIYSKRWWPGWTNKAAPRGRQAESKAEWNRSRCNQTADFFTCGYTGRKLDELIEAMKAAGIQCLVDVRQYPVSMYRPEVSKTNL